MQPRIALLTLSAATLVLAACEKQPLEPSGPGDLTVVAGRSTTGLVAPSNASATASSVSKVDITWQDNSAGESSYEVHRSTTGATGAFSLLVKASANTTAYADSGLASATQYCYRSRAVLLTGRKATYSAFSNTACAATPSPPPPVPDPPTAVSGLAATAYSNDVVLTWSDQSTNEAGFNIYRSINGGTWVLAGTQRFDSPTRFVDSGREYEQPVCYRVSAFNAGGESAQSNTACATPIAVPMLTVASPEPWTVDLTWTDNSLLEHGFSVMMENSSCCVGICPAWDPNWEEVHLAELPPNSTSFRYRQEGGFGSCTRFYVIARAPGAESSSDRLQIP